MTLMTAFMMFLIFGVPLLVGIFLLWLTSRLFRWASRSDSGPGKVFAWAMLIATLGAAGFMIFAFTEIFRVGSFAALALFVMPQVGAAVFVVLLLFLWSIFTLFTPGFSHGVVRIITALLILVAYAAVGAHLYRKNWKKDLLHDYSAAPEDIMQVYGNGKWRELSNGQIRSLLSRNRCPPELLWELADHKDPNVQLEISRCADIPPDLLLQLATNEYLLIRMELALRSGSSDEVLRRVATGEFNEQVALNLIGRTPRIPNEIIDILDMSELTRNARCRHLMASREGLSRKYYERLAALHDPGTLGLLAANPAVPTDILEQLVEEEYCVEVPRGAASNPNTPTNMLVMLAKHPDIDTRCRVARNSSTPPATVDMLAHEDSFVGRSARDMIFQRRGLPALREVMQK